MFSTPRTPCWSIMLCLIRVQGCDGSVLLDSTNKTAEKDSAPNLGSIRGLSQIDEVKAVLEAACPGVVSCADIITLVARDATVAVSDRCFALVESLQGLDSCWDFELSMSQVKSFSTLFSSYVVIHRSEVQIGQCHSVAETAWSLPRMRLSPVYRPLVTTSASSSEISRESDFLSKTSSCSQVHPVSWQSLISPETDLITRKFFSARRQDISFQIIRKNILFLSRCSKETLCILWQTYLIVSLTRRMDHILVKHLRSVGFSLDTSSLFFGYLTWKLTKVVMLVQVDTQ